MVGRKYVRDSLNGWCDSLQPSCNSGTSFSRERSRDKLEFRAFSRSGGKNSPVPPNIYRAFVHQEFIVAVSISLVRVQSDIIRIGGIAQRDESSSPMYPIVRAICRTCVIKHPREWESSTPFSLSIFFSHDIAINLRCLAHRLSDAGDALPSRRNFDNTDILREG